MSTTDSATAATPQLEKLPPLPVESTSTTTLQDGLTQEGGVPPPSSPLSTSNIKTTTTETAATFHPTTDYELPAPTSPRSSSSQSQCRESTVIISPKNQGGKEATPPTVDLAHFTASSSSTGKQYVSINDGVVSVKMPKVTAENKPLSVDELNKLLLQSLPPSTTTTTPLTENNGDTVSSTSSSKQEHNQQMLLQILSSASAQGVDINALIAEIEQRKQSATTAGGGAPIKKVVASLQKPGALSCGDRDVVSSSDEEEEDGANLMDALIPPIGVQSTSTNLQQQPCTSSGDASISEHFGMGGMGMTLPAVGGAVMPIQIGILGGTPNNAGATPPYPVVSSGMGSMRSLNNNNDSLSHSSLHTGNPVRSIVGHPGSTTSAATMGSPPNTVTTYIASPLFNNNQQQQQHINNMNGASATSMMDSMVVQGASMPSFSNQFRSSTISGTISGSSPKMHSNNINSSNQQQNSNLTHTNNNNNVSSSNIMVSQQFHPVSFGNSNSNLGLGTPLQVGGNTTHNARDLGNLSINGAPAMSVNSSSHIHPHQHQQHQHGGGGASEGDPLSPIFPSSQHHQSFSYTATAASQTAVSNLLHQAGDSINVLSQDRSMLLIIPRQLIDPTEGSASYDQQVSSHDTHHLAFKYRLCKLYAEGCPQGPNCVFIHSCHVLDGVPNQEKTLPLSRLDRGLSHLQVVENDVHFNAAVTGKVVDHLTLPPGRMFEVKIGRPGPSRTGHPAQPKMLVLPSEQILLTKASRAYFYNELNAPKIPQACSHYERACCARGSACGFVHRIINPSSQSSAVNTHVSSSSPSLPRGCGLEDMSSSSTTSSAHIHQTIAGHSYFPQQQQVDMMHRPQVPPYQQQQQQHYDPSLVGAGGGVAGVLPHPQHQQQQKQQQSLPLSFPQQHHQHMPPPQQQQHSFSSPAQQSYQQQQQGYNPMYVQQGVGHGFIPQQYMPHFNNGGTF